LANIFEKAIQIHLRMQQKITRVYTELGIDVRKSSIIEKYIQLIKEPESEIEDFELFHWDLILGLSEIKDFDYNSFKRYQSNINNSKDNLTFWGERYEVIWHYKLIKALNHYSYITDLKRGKDGLESDLIFNFNNSNIGIELTTLKFQSGLKNAEEILMKIYKSIFKKNSKPYANKNSALIIDVTNLNYHSKFTELSLKDILKTNIFETKNLIDKINFGMVILCQSEYRINEKGNRGQYLKPVLAIPNRKISINIELSKFLNLFFNNFKDSGDDYIVHYHKNI